MPKEKPTKRTEKLEPVILEKGEVAKHFKIVTPEKLEKLGLTSKPKEKIKTEVSFEKAQEIMGEDYLGSEAIKATFKYTPEEIPPIPFSIQELERAKELGQFLIFRIDQVPDGEPLTMAKLLEIIQPDFTASNSGKISNSLGNQDCWYKDEDLALKDVPRHDWALVSKDVLADSLNKNYLSQTECLARYIKEEVFKDQDLPEAYREAIQELESQKSIIEPLIVSDWQQAALRLSELKINQMCRHIPVEVFYDFVMRFKNNSKRYLEDKYTWTSRRSADGNLVNVGNADADGAKVNRWKPDNVNGALGVAFSEVFFSPLFRRSGEVLKRVFSIFYPAAEHFAYFLQVFLAI